MASIMDRYAGTRLGRQELDAEILEDTPGALWRLEDIDAARVSAAPPLQRIVIAVDPAVSSNDGSDETGIIVASRAEDGHCYILADCSIKSSPNEWASQAVRAYHRWHADRVIAEVNNGGMLVETTLRMVDPNVAYKAVHASRGKVARAEPIAALYEQRRVHHVGPFPELEDQLCAFTSDLNRARDGSPDRADALVWALSELAIQPEPGIIGWAREEAAKIEQARLNPAITNVHTVTLKAPEGTSGAYLLSGRYVQVPETRLVEMSPEDSKPLLAIGWTMSEGQCLDNHRP
jgi:phage terminase large subunit-like protein